MFPKSYGKQDPKGASCLSIDDSIFAGELATHREVTTA